MTDSTLNPADAPDALSPDAMTLDELRVALAPILPFHAAFDGWGAEALAQAAQELGVPADRAALAFPDGAIGMIDAWFAAIDADMAVRAPAPMLAARKIRDRITRLVSARLDAMEMHREALRRALAILAMPQNALRAARLGWRAADAMWRLAGDTAVDLSHYTKRLTLAGVYATTILVFVDDASEDFGDTRAFLDRRIAGVMRFERVKAQLKPDTDRMFSPVRFLGRLRYPAS
ncbi:MAG TPA: COQ9 family protein [Sphingomonas sp.]|jgi:ubiquinone biosynthesis protein COQ9|uniref:COQ9 family protein n=1 Tax=Sphingomonas sp. TaxID=28214 RepID=UPI002ED7F02E